jgi:hypothetical protein
LICRSAKSRIIFLAQASQNQTNDLNHIRSEALGFWILIEKKNPQKNRYFSTWYDLPLAFLSEKPCAKQGTCNTP